MTGRFAASDQVAIVGYAQAPVLRHADRPLGAIALDTARAAIADAGLDVAQIDGFTTGAIFPTAGAHTIEDGVSIVTRELAGRAPRRQPALGERLPGLRPDPGVGRAGRQRGRQRRRRLRPPAPGAAQPRRASYHGNPMREARGSMQWTAPQGYFGPLAMIALPYNEYLQRYGAIARRDGRGRGRGAQERGPHPVVVLARQAAHGRRLPRRAA